MVNWQISETITFEEGINLTKALLSLIESDQLNPQEIQERITNLVKTENGARGFFVTYLTDDSSLADNPTEAVITALKFSPNIVSELLVKNLAMSSAMAIIHRRNHNEEMAQGSDRVRQRTTDLIKQLQLELIAEKLHQLQESIATGEGKYQAFLERWGYDEEQKSVIKLAILNAV